MISFCCYKLKSSLLTVVLATLLFMVSAGLYAQPVSPEKVRTDFKVLLARTSSAPRPHFTTVTTDSMLVERGYFYSEATERVPVVIYKPVAGNGKKLPVVICLHGTGGSKDNADIQDLLHRFSKAGFMSVAIDARYHGERIRTAAGHNSYVEAITRAWENKNSKQQEHPFFYDTVYDLWKLVDYLVTRPDVDSSRLGMMGISMGGIETWMAASVDTRIKVAVPVIAAQSFHWSLEADRWQGRARTIWAAHVQAAKDLGDTGVNKNNVRLFWDKLLPGITGEFDCPSMIRLFAPRALLLLSTQNDQNCPLPGAQFVFVEAVKAYHNAHAAKKLKIDVAPNQPHWFTPAHQKMTLEWFIEWL
ncbi:MAG: acetylxylan esterase [Bacteroidota bacterium]